MRMTLRLGSRGAAGIAACGTSLVAILIGLTLGVPACRHAPDLELAFSAMAGLGLLVIVARPLTVAAERPAWVMFALAIVANTVTEALELWAPGGRTGVVEVVFGIVAFPLAAVAVVLMVRERLGRMRTIAWLDGITGALVVMTVLAIAVLAT